MKRAGFAKDISGYSKNKSTRPLGTSKLLSGALMTVKN